jgi:hypothetical protein
MAAVHKDYSSSFLPLDHHLASSALAFKAYIKGNIMETAEATIVTPFAVEEGQEPTAVVIETKEVMAAEAKKLERLEEEILSFPHLFVEEYYSFSHSTWLAQAFCPLTGIEVKYQCFGQSSKSANLQQVYQLCHLKLRSFCSIQMLDWLS